MDVFGIYARADAYFAPKRPDLIQRGNFDLEDSCTWTPTAVQPSAAHLGVYPEPADLLIEVDR